MNIFKIIAIGTSLLFLSHKLIAQAYYSPNKNISFETRTHNGQLQYACNFKDTKIIDWSPIAFETEKGITGTDCLLKLISSQQKNDAFQTLGNHTKANLNYQALRFIIKDKKVRKQKLYLDVRLYDLGVAFRFQTQSSKEIRVMGDKVNWNIVNSPDIFYPTNDKMYEGVYLKSTLTALKNDSNLFRGTISPPVAFNYSDKNIFALISEAKLLNYSGMKLKATERGFVNFFPHNRRGWKMKGQIQSPWRTIVITNDLTQLVNCDIFTSLCDAPSQTPKELSWIKPGRSAWQWWAVGAPKLEDQQYWYDKTAELGFEYYLIDAGWESWQHPTKDKWTLLKECIDYGKSKNIESTVWVHSRYLRTAEQQDQFFSKLKKAGAAGVKIDFFPPESYKVVKWYEELLKRTMDYHLLINFHGCNKPTGLSRTYPHELTREAVRGQEYHISRYKRTIPPAHDVILPFTRYTTGYGDYTPMVFNAGELFGNSWARELAKPIVFTSPLVHYADYPLYYIGHPAEDIIKALPSTWDETIVLPSTQLGKHVVMARRKGDNWFIAALNNENPKDLEIDLSFLHSNNYQAVLIFDTDMNNLVKREEKMVNSNTRLSVHMNSAGGFVAWIKVKHK